MRVGQSEPKISRKEAMFPTVLNRDNKNMSSHKSQALLLSSPTIERSKRNLMLMREINPLNQTISDTESDTSLLAKRIESGKKGPLPSVVVLKENEKRKSLIDSKYIKENLVGEEAVKKFYERYKHIEKAQKIEEFTKQRNPVTQIVTLLSQHNFAPRKLDLIKLKGSEAILSLKKLGLGQGSMGPVVAELVEYLSSFDEVDLSYNCIDYLLSDMLIPNLGKIKKINLSHNRIGKTGCLRLSELFSNRKNLIQELSLEENNLPDHAILPLIQQIPLLRKLKILKLSKNFLSLKSAHKIKEMLYDDEVLTELYLSWNEFTSKATKFILEGVERNTSLRVLDFSWNPIDEYNTQILEKIFSRNDNLVHIDISFCELNLKSTQRLSKALEDNHSLYGIHYEGNSGYIDHKGYIKQTEKEHFEYPLPIIRGITREINGVHPNPVSNEFKSRSIEDVCWICSCWQELHLKIDKELHPEIKECYVHFEHEKYISCKMVQNKDCFEFYRMCLPDTKLYFLFTVISHSGNMQHVINTSYHIVPAPINIPICLGEYSLNVNMPEINVYTIPFTRQPINTEYLPNVRCQPRTTELSVLYQPKHEIHYHESPKEEQQYLEKKTLYRTRTVIREERVEKQFQDIPEHTEFLNDYDNRDNDEVYYPIMQEYLKKCIQFDIGNSKINKLLKSSEVVGTFIQIMVNYYKHFKNCFYFLARNNPNFSAIFSIPEIEVDKFVEDQRYISKRVTPAKIRLKLYTCLSVGENNGKNNNGKNSECRLISRPQFLEFLIRIAIEKWCVKVPTKKEPSEDKNIDEEEPDKKKLKLPLSLIEGIEKVMSGLEKYSIEVRAENWRMKKYLKVEIYIVIKGYEDFLHSLFEKYSLGKNKLRKSKKLQGLITLDDFKNIFLEAQLKRTKESMKEAEQMFLYAKRLEIEDGRCEYGLNYDEFLECLTRYSESIWFDPVASPKLPFWESEMNKLNTPLFLRLEAMIVNIYWGQVDLHSKRMSRTCKHGLFEQECALIMEKIKERDCRSKTSIFLKMNTLEEDEPDDINLKDILEELKEKEGLSIFRHEETIKEEYEADDDY